MLLTCKYVFVCNLTNFKSIGENQKMRKLKKGGIVLLAAVLVALFIPLFTACSLMGDKFSNFSHYSMDITLRYDDKAIDVSMTLDYRNNYDVELKDLHLHIFANAFREDAQFRPVAAHEMADAFPNGASWGGIDIKSVSVAGSSVPVEIIGEDYNVLRAPFANALMPGHRTNIQIEFSVQLANVRHRLGWYNGLINLGNFFPIAAVFQNGAFATNVYYYLGDPFFSAASNFDVSITKPSNLTAAMSGATVREANGGTATTTASIQGARDFAIVLGEFEVIHQMVGDVQVRYYFHNDSESAKNLQAAVDSMVTFSDMFGAYPWATFSTVQTAFLHGGMEFPALTMISDELSGDTFREVIIHEAAHQWWYAVVGNDQVRHSWIDESLTQMATSLFFEANPQYGVTYESRMAEALSMLTLYAQVFRDQPNFSTAMCRPLGEFANSLEYVVMAYYKGKIMLDVVRTQIGNEAFMLALRNLYADNMFGVIDRDLFIAAFETASQRQLAPFFDAWLDGTIAVF